MGMNEKVIIMAYVLGMLKRTNLEILKLGDYNPEWSHYKMTHHINSEEDRNDNYALCYDDVYGKESTGIARIITVAEGMSIKHMANIIVDAINMHKAEKVIK